MNIFTPVSTYVCIYSPPLVIYISKQIPSFDVCLLNSFTLRFTAVYCRAYKENILSVCPVCVFVSVSAQCQCLWMQELYLWWHCEWEHHILTERKVKT